MALIDLNPERSLITIPGVQKYRRSSDGLWVTPALGKSGVKEVLLGSDGATATEFPTLIKPRGFNFDGGDQLTVPDNGLLSFGDGVSDRPFSVAMMVSCVFTTAFAPLGKGASGDTTLEYACYDSGSYIYFFLFSQGGTSAYIYGRMDRTEFLESIVRVFIVTYSGARLASGIKIYVDGVLPSTFSVGSVGTYAAMDALGADLVYGDTSLSNNHVGDIIAPMLFDFELSPAEVQALTERYKSLYSITPR